MHKIPALVAFLLSISGFATGSHAQQIALDPEIIDGTPIRVTITGLPAATQVRVDARRIDASGTAFASTAEYRTDGAGQIDLATATAIDGDYRGVDPAGLFSAMRRQDPVSADRATIRLIVNVDGRPAATATARLIDPVSRIAVEEIPQFVGARLYRPLTSGRLPVVIILGGSEGGTSYGRRIGPQLALEGFAAIALPYHDPAWNDEDLPGLPTAFADIPVDRLADVHRWIARRADLAADRIAISGVSKGGEFALLAATRFSWVRAVVGIVPSDVVWEGWGNAQPEGTSSSFAWRGRPMPFTPYLGMNETIAALGRGERRSLTQPHLAGRRAAPDRAAAARIAVERYRGPMFIAGGDRDVTWPSGMMVQAIAERRAEAGLATVAFSFPEAGHGLAGTAWEPMNYPGNETLAADSAARQILWPRMLMFLRDALAR